VHFRATTRFIDEKDLSDHVETGNAVSQFSDRKSWFHVARFLLQDGDRVCGGFVRGLEED
jgi:hypothetical protein